MTLEVLTTFILVVVEKFEKFEKFKNSGDTIPNYLLK